MSQPAKPKKPAFILRRCSLCKRFHADFIFEDPRLGKLYLCPDCWKKKVAENNPQLTQMGADKEE